MNALPPRARVNVYDAIDANRRRTVVLVAGFVAVIAALAWVFGELLEPGAGLALLPFGLLLAGGTSAASYFAGDRMILGVSQARELGPDDEVGLWNVVEALSIGAGLPKPRLYVIEDSAPNAFATGRDPKHASVAVTRGLLDKLDRTELEAVMAHELSHVQNRDIRVLLLATALAGTLVLFSDMLLRSMRFGAVRRGGDRRRGGGGGVLILVAILLAILAPIAARVIRLAISREREFLADASAALLTRYPPALASALRKISADREPLEVANKATEALYFANPLKDRPRFLDRLFETHPPVEERIRRLEAM
ncbi:MAG TPA: M48 family metallopeptidase [Candidatus Limnocylindrales bacterium]|nr:M48 family metallopeptidase [Candidatus Limnocylindrales bacterium]